MSVLILRGVSGCGKSTTLRMVAGLETVTEGKIYIGNTIVNYMPPKDRDIAMVFQNYALYPHMNVYKNMAFGLQIRKTPKEDIDRRFEYLDRLIKSIREKGYVSNRELDKKDPLYIKTKTKPRFEAGFCSLVPNIEDQRFRISVSQCK